VSVNLIPSEAKFQAQRIRFGKKMVKISQVLGAVWLSLVVVIFGIWIVLRQLYQVEKNKLGVAEKAYEQMSNKLITNQKLRYKIKLVSQIIDGRFEYARAFNTVNEYLPPEANVTKLELKKDGKFAIELQIMGARAMEEMEAKIKATNEGMVEAIESVVLKSIAVNNGTWSLALEVGIK
jgi:hypothetical protein